MDRKKRERPGILELFYVGLQLIFFVLYLFKVNIFLVTYPASVRYVFLFLSILGFCILALGIIQLRSNLTPFPSPKTGSYLVTNGLYKYIRHPIYTGIFCMLFFYGFYAMSIFKICISIALLVLFHFKSKYEEKLLEEKFEMYARYMKDTAKFFPGIF
ncbi:MAG: isoprenylcysteine carboxylmethyltransferase family protein [Flavobacteriales bacterium]|nr:isoprenylcysteine carboxylmethyltransferase family protein [Flavobacteriales bacterium]